jgi:hypothetical protein
MLSTPLGYMPRNKTAIPEQRHKTFLFALLAKSISFPEWLCHFTFSAAFVSIVVASHRQEF